MTQKQLGDRVGLSQSAISEIETGNGGGYSLNAWQEVFLALGRPLIIDVRRDQVADPVDAGHLAIQELVLRFASSAGFAGTFELPLRPGLSRHSVDIFLRNDRRRLLIVCEAWNSFGDIGAASRSFSWKLGQAEEVAGGLADQYRVSGCWIVRATLGQSIPHRAISDDLREQVSRLFPGVDKCPHQWLRATPAAGVDLVQSRGHSSVSDAAALTRLQQAQYCEASANA